MISIARRSIKKASRAASAGRPDFIRRHCLDGSYGFHVLSQPLTSNVEATLDRADWSIEIVGHLDQRTTADVERHERLAVKPAQRLEAPANLTGPLAVNSESQRRAVLDAGSIQRFALNHMVSRPADQPVDGHAVRDRAQPTGESLGLAQLADLLHRLDEDVLAQFLSLAEIVEP